MTDDVRQFLSQPQVYPDFTTQVQVIETHISWVFLTDQFVYKLKKPVRFDFLDFSTVERRQQDCEREITLNRRLATDVYLDVVPVMHDSAGQLRLGGSGRPVDWTVKMKRLPAEAALDQMIQSDRVTLPDIDRLAERLLAFYRSLPPARIQPEDYFLQLEAHVRANAKELGRSDHQLDASVVSQVHAAQLRFLSLCHDQLIRRVRDGHVIDGHGDLRPEHIYLTPDPAVIDCIEFSSEFRTLDVVDELAFLSMECDRLAANWIGDRILAAYLRDSSDHPDAVLVPFFKCYRACVRAKVNAIRANQLGSKTDASVEQDVAREYLQLAAQYAARLGPPLLLVVRGTSGTGKSKLASCISNDWGAVLLQTDVVRQSLFPSTGCVSSAAHPSQSTTFGTGKYSPENRKRVYDELLRLAADPLRHGQTVILDGTFLSKDSRGQALELARETSAEVVLVRCHCPENVAAERVRARGQSASEILPELLAQQRAHDEPDDPAWPVLQIDTSDGVATTRQQIDGVLRAKLGLGGG